MFAVAGRLGLYCPLQDILACPALTKCCCGPAGSQRKFNKRILALGPAVVNDDFIERAVDRYCEFLALARDNPRELVVPTLDIDLIWHAHMLSPQDYHDVRVVLYPFLRP